MDEFQILLIIVSAVANGVMIYVGFSRGSAKTIDLTIEKMEQRARESPTAQRLLKIMEASDRLFGDDEAVGQMSKFFKEGTELMSDLNRLAKSSEAKEVLVITAAFLNHLLNPPEPQDNPEAIQVKN